MLFPQPLGPMMLTNSPSDASKSMFCNTSSGVLPFRGKLFETPRISTSTDPTVCLERIMPRAVHLADRWRGLTSVDASMRNTTESKCEL